jgi:CubicO group peptidase (beta-lactamase class C family)
MSMEATIRRLHDRHPHPQGAEEMMTLDEAISVTEHSAWLGANSVEIDAWSIIKNHLSQPQPGAQGEAVAYVNPEELAALVRDAKKFGKTQYCIEAFAKPAGMNTTPLFDTPAIPTGHRVVPVEPKLIGWRTADYTHETDSVEMARNWSANVAVLPIFEGDPNTKIAASPSAGGV